MSEKFERYAVDFNIGVQHVEQYQLRDITDEKSQYKLDKFGLPVFFTFESP
jgi:membrane protease subunit (stomatin/prohibitin family)